MDPSDRTALVEAANWAESYQQSQPQEHNYQEIFAQTTLAWVDLARGRVDEADARLIGLAEISKINRWGDAFIKVQALRALASAGRGDMEASLDNLEIALARAAPEGYIRTIIDFGQPMRELLHLTKKRGVASAYTDRLLSAYQASDGEEVEAKPQNSSFDQPPLEILTDQEIHILRLMAAGLSHREIADEIYLSVNTIKWHTGNIYSKLGVHRRAHAVFRAQELGIL